MLLPDASPASGLHLHTCTHQRHTKDTSCGVPPDVCQTKSLLFTGAVAASSTLVRRKTPGSV